MNRRSGGRSGAVGLVVLLLALGCASSLEPRLITVPEAGLRPAAHIDGIFSYRAAAATIADLLGRELGFPSFPITFHFFPDQQAFEAALRDLGYDPVLARDAARTMRAIGGHRKVLLNEGALAPLEWRDRVALLAHEAAHTLQYELGGGRRGTSDQWLREGFGEWFAMRVLARLRAVAPEAFRRQRLQQLRSTNRSRAPGLEAMVTFPQWVALSGRSDLDVYAQAFLAVDALIERRGIPALMAYFAAFARSQDRLANFRAAFGEELASFEAALAKRMR